MSSHISAQTVGILGSGIMGAGVTEVFARAGHRVIVRSRTDTSAAAVTASVERSLRRQVERGKIDEPEAQSVISRISATTSLSDLAPCDLILESVVEDLPTKLALFAELDACAAPHAVLATNTSTLPVVELARITQRPDRVCGIHFFNPATAMTLVEIVRPVTASDATINYATRLIASCGKDTVAVRDDAGFIVNALLFPYLNNAIKMYERGTASIVDIDTAMKGGCSFPMGPFSLLDLVGLDTSLSILETLHTQFNDDNFVPAATLRRLVAEGHLGRKTGQGFLSYTR
jgi:3-hydroxybutyryl-CoA dehydrogenase